MVIFAVLYGQMQNLTQSIQTLIYEKESKANFIPLRWTFHSAKKKRKLHLKTSTGAFFEMLRQEKRVQSFQSQNS